MDRKQILKIGIHLIPALLTIALILGCASRPDLEKIPEHVLAQFRIVEVKDVKEVLKTALI